MSEPDVEEDCILESVICTLELRINNRHTQTSEKRCALEMITVMS